MQTAFPFWAEKDIGFGGGGLPWQLSGEESTWAMGSIPGSGRSHMPYSKWACAPQLLRLSSGAHKLQVLSLRATATETRA